MRLLSGEIGAAGGHRSVYTPIRDEVGVEFLHLAGIIPHYFEVGIALS